MKKIFSHLKEYGFLYSVAISLTCMFALMLYLCFLITDRNSAGKELASELLNSSNKYSVTLSNKNWTWYNIAQYETVLRNRYYRDWGEVYAKIKIYEAFKKYNALYFKNEIVGVLFSVNFEDKEPKLYFNLRDDVKIKSNSHLMRIGKDFLIIENPMGVYDDKKEFSYINNDNSLPYENNKEIKEQKITVRGLEIADLSPAIANKYKIYDKKGVVVTKPYNQVLNGILQNGDLIVSLDGKPVENVKDFCNIIVNTGLFPRVVFLRQGLFGEKYFKANQDNDCLAYIKKDKK